MNETWSMTVKNEAALGQLAGELARAVPVGTTLLLSGTLGAGKTSFARAFIWALCGEAVEVVSPTFLLVQEYPSPQGMIYHYDFYRLEDASDVRELGLDEVIGTATCLIEWPSQVAFDWPRDRLELSLELQEGDPSVRVVVAAAHGSVLGKVKQCFLHGKANS